MGVLRDLSGRDWGEYQAAGEMERAGLLSSGMRPLGSQSLECSRRRRCGWANSTASLFGLEGVHLPVDSGEYTRP